VNSQVFDKSKSWQESEKKIHKSQEGLEGNFVRKGTTEIAAGMIETTTDLKNVGKNVVQAITDPAAAAKRLKKDPDEARLQGALDGLVEKSKK